MHKKIRRSPTNRGVQSSRAALHAGLYVCEGDVYLAVVYQHGVLVRDVGVVVVVCVVVELRLGHLKVFGPALLCVEAVQLVLGEVVHDARAIRVAHHVHRRAEAVPASLQGR